MISKELLQPCLICTSQKYCCYSAAEWLKISAYCKITTFLDSLSHYAKRKTVWLETWTRLQQVLLFLQRSCKVSWLCFTQKNAINCQLSFFNNIMQLHRTKANTSGIQGNFLKVELFEFTIKWTTFTSLQRNAKGKNQKHFYDSLLSFLSCQNYIYITITYSLI